jgi:flagellar biosynthesis/type III secretory pathway protein FliH
MTGIRALVLVSVVTIAASGCALAAYGSDPQRYPGNRPAYDDQRDRGDDRRAVSRYDLALQHGFDDGYEAGERDGQRGDRFDPIGERRYRAADHGYDRRYGPRDVYKNRYRDAFRRGYENGYREGRRYDRRTPRWWPF